MAGQAKDEISQLAQQGSLQALSVYLNRHLIPYGAHVKLKSKDSVLSILVVVMQDGNNDLIDITQSLITKLSPAQIQRCKIYFQILGQKQAVLKQRFVLSGEAEAAENGSKRSVDSSSTNPARLTQEHHLAPSRARASEAPTSKDLPPSKLFPQESTPSNNLKPTKDLKPNRYSVAEFLAQSTDLKELALLRDHPFVTGHCPQCRHQFNVSTPPTYWDCPACGWQDNLTALAPQQEPPANQTSLAESKRLGDYLIEAGLLTEAQIEVALADQMTTGLRFGEVLTRRGWVKEETIEYLMKKIVIPERLGAGQSASSFLASSRNLLKALIHEQSADQDLLPTPPTPEIRRPKQTYPPVQPSSAPATSAASTQASPPSKPANRPSVGKLPNERETLILPDLDISEYLKDA